MENWTLILTLLGLGVILWIIEIIFIPGTTIVGIFGTISCIAGVYYSFVKLGTSTGYITLIATSLIGVLFITLALRSGTWNKFALKKEIKSKVNEGKLAILAVGQEGITLSALRPIGKAEFEDKEFEVKTLGNYLETGTPIKIIAIDKSKQIIVEPLSNNI